MKTQTAGSYPKSFWFSWSGVPPNVIQRRTPCLTFHSGQPSRPSIFPHVCPTALQADQTACVAPLWLFNGAHSLQPHPLTTVRPNASLLFLFLKSFSSLPDSLPWSHYVKDKHFQVHLGCVCVGGASSILIAKQNLSGWSILQL